MIDNSIFDIKKCDVISELVERKIPLLKENKDYNEKYNKFYEIMNLLEKNLNKEEKELFNELIDLNYEIEKYYNVLAYSLGVKYGEELNKI